MTDRPSPFELALDVALYAPVGLAVKVAEELPQLVEKGRSRLSPRIVTARLVGQFAVAQGRKEATKLVEQVKGAVADAGLFGSRTSTPGPRRYPSPARRAPWTSSPVAPSLADPPHPTSAAATSAAATSAAAIPEAATSGEAIPEVLLASSGDGDDHRLDQHSDGPSRVSRPFGPLSPSGSTNGRDRAAEAGSTGRGLGALGRGPRPSSEGLAIPGYDSLSASQVVQRLAGLTPDELEAVRLYESDSRGRRTILSRVAQLQAG